MPKITTIKVGDIVRVRQPIALVPLDNRAPSEIPAGIFGQVIRISNQIGDEIFYQVEFHEPYEYANEISIRADMLEVIFRFSLN